MNELKLPKIGFGTWQLKPKDCTDSVLKAIETGYRHIDTAQMYGNEAEIGQALAQETIDRKELIIATKLAIWRFRKKSVIKSTEKSLEKLNLDYLDLLYVHWPAPIFYSHKRTLGAMSQLVDQGKVRHIGVSNFTRKLLDKAQEVCDKPIAANQIEHHPWLKQLEMRKYLREHDIYFVAYSPLIRGKVSEIPELNQVAEKHNCSEYQVSLAWIMNHDAVPIPKATSEDHIRDNYASLDVNLDDEDIEKIDSIEKEKRLLNPPIIRPW
ncbi:MAG: aldo/keto reductase [Candidatus Lokiarchaeota archaeon]|nr:aldo/keto reductase [Candidatus Lokiarchaeota archaeon]